MRPTDRESPQAGRHLAPAPASRARSGFTCRSGTADGEQVFTALMAQADADEHLNWAVSVDSTIVRAHQHAAGALKKCPYGLRQAVTGVGGS